MKILLLAGNTLRSRAYAQQLSRCNGIEVTGLFLGHEQRACEAPILNDETKSFFSKAGIFIPNLSEPLLITFQKQTWSFSATDTTDVNSEEVLSVIRQLKVDLIIFSGYGGQILSKNHFESKTQYLHMHPGFLPEERGSTTIYYSILNHKKCSVTAFFMTAEIDAGAIVLRKQYPVPKQNVNIDNWYDNAIRADCMFDAINALVLFKENCISLEDTKLSEEYYIIHPILKHLSILMTEKNVH